MERLPEELQLAIFKYTWNADIRTFLNCLRCSKKWHRIALPILYTHVCTSCNGNFLNLSLWIATFHTRLQAKDSIQSLTLINITSLTNFRQADLDLFLEALSQFSRLRSFSINTNLVPCPSSIYSHHSNDTIAQVLKALPSSVVELEVFVAPLHRIPCLFRHHLCDAIAALVPRLESLRLQVPRICPDFLPCSRNASSATDVLTPSTSKLRSVSIWLISQRRHFLDTIDCAAQAPGPKPYVDWGKAWLMPSEFARSIQRLHDQGSLPYLKNFSIVSRERMQWSVREVVSDATLHIYDERRDGRRPSPRSDGNVKDMRPVWSQLLDLVEPGNWVTMCNKSRISQPSLTTVDFKARCEELVKTDAWATNSPECDVADLTSMQDIMDGYVDLDEVSRLMVPSVDWVEGV